MAIQKKKIVHKPQRILRKSKSWIQKNSPRTNKEIRWIRAQMIKTHRQGHFDPAGYERHRNLKTVKEEFGIDLAKIVRQKVQRGGEIKILDSGAGFINVGAEFKMLSSKGKIFVTALNPISAEIPKKVETVLLNKIAKLNESPKKQFDLQAHLTSLRGAQRNAKIVDEYRVGLIEKFSTKKKYDLILDFYGPMHYSNFTERVVEQYFSLLNSNGCAFIAVESTNSRMRKEIASNYGPNSKRANATGFYLSLKQFQNKPNVFELKKINCKK